MILFIFYSCSDDEPEKDNINDHDQIEIEKVESLPVLDSTVLLSQIDESPIEKYQKTIYTPEDTFQLNIPRGFDIAIVADSMKRIRFMDLSPDGRLFLTDMYNLADNKKGKVYILDDFDDSNKEFKTKHVWQTKLRNPNDVKFYRDTNGQNWIYIAQTHAVVRYKYQEGELSPSSKPQIVDTFPDYGLSYKYGGWHLTRSMDFHNNKLYISVGSSCNSCEEKETERERASILEMNPDGSEKIYYAEGVRNAVEIKWVNDIFFASNMGADHFGDELPDDQFLIIEKGMHYGWPYCYQDGWTLKDDTSQKWTRKKMNCEDVPKIYQPLGAHIAPLGFEYFEGHTNNYLRNYFLIAHHGSVTLRKGYEIVRVKNGILEVFIDGFRGPGKKKYGRPCDIFRYRNGFLFTDDHKGRLYYVFPTKS